MIFETEAELKERIEHLTPRRVYGRIPIFEDSSSYMSIYGGTVLRLAGNDYFIMGDTHEGRFGIGEQPKFWVKYAVDLATGEDKIIKLVFHELFTTKIGPITVRCTRSPQKECDFLNLVRGDRRFMQGFSVTDPAGNLVRVIDFVRGRTHFNRIVALPTPHEQYYFEELPGVMGDVIDAIEAMAWVHDHGLHHGDIRNDHLIVDVADGHLVWIDFDYAVNFLDYDIWSAGNVVIYTAAKGITTFRAVRNHPEDFPPRTARLDDSDASAFYPYRIANLRKVYPYVSKDLNDILLRFSAGSLEPYTDLGSLARDLRETFAS